MAKKYFKAIVFIAFMFIAQVTFAQGPPPPPPPIDLPINGGVIVLFLAAIGFGIKKIVDSSKK